MNMHCDYFIGKYLISIENVKSNLKEKRFKIIAEKFGLF